jgi:hypothetical protein
MIKTVVHRHPCNIDIRQVTHAKAASNPAAQFHIEGLPFHAIANSWRPLGAWPKRWAEVKIELWDRL